MLHRVYGNSEEKNKISLGLMQEGKTRWINGKEPSERVRKHDKSLNNWNWRSVKVCESAERGIKKKNIKLRKQKIKSCTCLFTKIKE